MRRTKRYLHSGSVTDSLSSVQKDTVRNWMQKLLIQNRLSVTVKKILDHVVTVRSSCSTLRSPVTVNCPHVLTVIVTMMSSAPVTDKTSQTTVTVKWSLSCVTDMSHRHTVSTPTLPGSVIGEIEPLRRNRIRCLICTCTRSYQKLHMSSGRPSRKDIDSFSASDRLGFVSVTCC